jgi:hypothetical protein
MRYFLLFFLILFSPVVAYAQPAIGFDSEKYNFGTVSELSLEHTFDFMNTGDEDLVIKRVTPS